MFPLSLYELSGRARVFNNRASTIRAQHGLASASLCAPKASGSRRYRLLRRIDSPESPCSHDDLSGDNFMNSTFPASTFLSFSNSPFRIFPNFKSLLYKTSITKFNVIIYNRGMYLWIDFIELERNVSSKSP